MNFEYVNNDKFIHFLQQELVRRLGDNPRYSLRAFARACETSPGALSAIMSRKRPLSSKTKSRIGAALGLSPRDFGTVADRKASLKEELLSADRFAVISEWYHYAILELIKVRGFQPRYKWIGHKLGISTAEVQAAVERLERLGLLERTADKWIDKYSDKFLTNFDGQRTSGAQRRQQSQMLKMSLDALEQVPLELRNHTSVTLAIALADLPKAKKLIKNFERRFTELMEQCARANEVYHLVVNFYPVSKLNMKEKSK